jgi:hypothetical protein
MLIEANEKWVPSNWNRNCYARLIYCLFLLRLHFESPTDLDWLKAIRWGDYEHAQPTTGAHRSVASSTFIINDSRFGSVAISSPAIINNQLLVYLAFYYHFRAFSPEARTGEVRAAINNPGPTSMSSLLIEFNPPTPLSTSFDVHNSPPRSRWIIICGASITNFKRAQRCSGQSLLASK